MVCGALSGVNIGHISPNPAKSSSAYGAFTQATTHTKGRPNKGQVRKSLGLALQRGWAKLMPDRCRDLVQHPNQPVPRRPRRPTRTTRRQTPSTTTPAFLAMGGRPLEGSPCLEFSWYLLALFPSDGGGGGGGRNTDFGFQIRL